ncbi:MAG: AbrB/MazE/SpoVT family DNA-binding domain-containing protein [Nitrososphaera sp.]
MSKIKFVRHPRSIIRKRQDYPSSLFVTIPKRIVQKSDWKPGDLLEFVVMVEDEHQFVKVRKV